METNKIYQIDAYEGMQELDDNSVDLVLTDPPYNLGELEWDYKDNYEEWIKRIFNSLQKVSRQQVIFFDYEYTKLFEELEEPEERFIWHREGGYRGEWIKKGYEPFYWYGEDITYNRITEYNPYSETDDRLNEERTISNVWDIPNLVGKKRESTDHPTQKPIKLFKRIVKMCSNEGDLILDPFIGSGTTGVAAKALDRDFIGFEKNEDYVEIARERLSKVQKELIR